MLFNSYEFITLFLPVTLLIFFLLGKFSLSKYSVLWLVLASLFFYGWWNPIYLYLILLSIIVNYSVGIFILNSSEVKSKYFLMAGVLFNLLLLSYFKYSNFFIETLNNSLSLNWNTYNILLPIGISFFTFQQIAYLIDVKNNRSCEKNLLHYSLFVVFFPQLIAGPIVHHSQMFPQFHNLKKFTPALSNISIGLSIFIIGLFKKVVLADNLAQQSSPIFNLAETGEMINFLQAWIATLAFSLQLYLDFSGYSDMAIGLARMFGIILPLNFYSPYKSTSIIEFWQRWHMTLSAFLRDYLYIPLGGSRKGNIRRNINIMLTMLLGGLWHGAAWTFILWGGLHGVFIIINHLWRRIFPNPKNGFWSVFIARSFTFLLVSIAWVMFRAESFDGAIKIYKGMFNLPLALHEKFGDSVLYLKLLGFSYNEYYIDLLDVKILLALMGGVLLLWILPNTQQLLSNFNPAHDYAEKSQKFKGYNSIININKYIIWQPSLYWALFISVLFILSFLSLTHISEFLYFQF